MADVTDARPALTDSQSVVSNLLAGGASRGTAAKATQRRRLPLRDAPHGGVRTSGTPSTAPRRAIGPLPVVAAVNRPALAAWARSQTRRRSSAGNAYMASIAFGSRTLHSSPSSPRADPTPGRPARRADKRFHRSSRRLSAAGHLTVPSSAARLPMTARRPRHRCRRRLIPHRRGRYGPRQGRTRPAGPRRRTAAELAGSTAASARSAAALASPASDAEPSERWATA